MSMTRLCVSHPLHRLCHHGLLVVPPLTPTILAVIRQVQFRNTKMIGWTISFQKIFTKPMGECTTVIQSATLTEKGMQQLSIHAYISYRASWAWCCSSCACMRCTCCLKKVTDPQLHHPMAKPCHPPFFATARWHKCCSDPLRWLIKQNTNNLEEVLYQSQHDKEFIDLTLTARFQQRHKAPLGHTLPCLEFKFQIAVLEFIRDK